MNVPLPRLPSSASTSACTHGHSWSDSATPTIVGTPRDDLLAHRQHEAAHYANQQSVKRKLIWASLVCVVFMVAEVVGGYLASSIALMTDATHMLTDLMANCIGLFAIWVASKSGGHALSFGYHRVEILGALVSVLLIWGLTIGLVWEAVQKVIKPEPVDGAIMTIVAIVGLVANIIMTQILKIHNHGIGGHECDHHHHDSHAASSAHDQHTGPCFHDHQHEAHRGHDAEEPPALPHYECSLPPSAFSTANVKREKGSMNLRAAYMHALGDLIQSVGVMIAGVCIWVHPSWLIADPICTFIFSFFVLSTTLAILRDVTTVLMEGTPKGVDVDHLQDDLALIPGVVELHDLHVWSLSVGKPSLSVHIVAEQEDIAPRILRTATKICQEHFNILHTTIQIDYAKNQLDCNTIAHRKCSSYAKRTRRNSPASRR